MAHLRQGRCMRRAGAARGDFYLMRTVAACPVTVARATGVSQGFPQPGLMGLPRVLAGATSLRLLLLLLLLLLGPVAAAQADGPAAAYVRTALQNPMPLYNSSGQVMNVHDGDVRQWKPGGPFYYYGMRYDRCHYQFCAQKNCSHLKDHTVLIWRSDTLANCSWTLVGEALGPAALKVLGNFYRPHVQYNPTTQRYVMVLNGNGLGNYKNFAATSPSPEGPFVDPQDMNKLAFESPANCPGNSCQMGDFGFFVSGCGEY